MFLALTAKLTCGGLLKWAFSECGLLGRRHHARSGTAASTLCRRKPQGVCLFTNMLLLVSVQCAVPS